MKNKITVTYNFVFDDTITLLMPVIFFNALFAKSRLIKSIKLDFYITDLLKSEDDIILKQ